MTPNTRCNPCNPGKRCPQTVAALMRTAARVAALAMAVGGLSGCSSLLPAAEPPPAHYMLQGVPSRQAAAPQERTRAQGSAQTTAPMLVVNVPRAAAGFDSARIIYTRQPQRLEYFARSEWVDTPARMLAPLMVSAVAERGAFRAVVQAPSTAVGDLRLDTIVLRLQQEFGATPSRVRFTLRAQLIDDKTHRVMASREFEGLASAASEDPVGGVLAAQLAVQTVMDELAAFCADAAAAWRPVPLAAGRAPQ